MATKLYFRNEDAETCYQLKYHLQEAKEEGLSEVELFEAIPEKIEGYFYCREFGISEEDIDACGKLCSHYSPRNGKSGICKLKGKTYRHGETKTFKVK